jgi:PAS domain S-box-containing protein
MRKTSRKIVPYTGYNPRTIPSRLTLALVALTAFAVGLSVMQLAMSVAVERLRTFARQLAGGTFTLPPTPSSLVPALNRLEADFGAMAQTLLAREQQQRQCDERFRLIAESISEVFWMADVPLRKMLYVSPGYERIWDRSCESLYEDPQSFLMAVHPGDIARVLDRMAVKQRGEAFEQEYRIIRPDGTIRWIWDRGFPIRDDQGRLMWFAGIAQDVTARVRAEEARRDIEGRMRFALDAAQVGVWEADLVNDVSFWSETCERMHGLPTGGFGRNLGAFLDRVDAEDRERVRRAIDQAIEERREIEIEYLTTWPDGSKHWIVSTAHFFYDETGRAVRGAGVTVDMTERRLLEQRLRQALETARQSS